MVGEQICQATHYVRGWPQNCYRHAVEEVSGEWLCKLHANGKRRSQAHSEKQDAEWRADQAQTKELVDLADRLSEALGTTVEAHHSARTGKHTGRMVVSVEFLESLIVD